MLARFINFVRTGGALNYYLVILIKIFTLSFFLYLVFWPFYPELSYELSLDKQERASFAKEIDHVKQETEGLVAELPRPEHPEQDNRIIITKIGVNAPVIISDSEEALERGAWLLPQGSTPDKGGNTIIAGHRFKYKPPSSLTFYLFHKLSVGDIVSVLWQGESYFYTIKEIKIVEPTAVEILDPSDDPILTLFTCHPLYSTEKRLVVWADLLSF